EEAEAVARAIRDMVVRGAPAIGIAAAYGAVLAARAAWAAASPPSAWREAAEAGLRALAASRPTAVNLFWALERMGRAMDRAAAAGGDPLPALLAEARRIHEEDRAANRRMGALGAALLERPGAVLTHCNAGALATGGYGTALGVVRAGWAAGRITRVYADETRPWLQGARLTAWELAQEGIPVTLLVEGAAASLLRTGRVTWVIVGADRIAANGDVANKVGTYGLAVLARRHGVGFMVVAPTATIDPAAPTGEAIPIEERDPAEVLGCAGRPVAPRGVEAWNPSFDVTPAHLVDALVTERGVLRRPGREGLRRLLAGRPAGA
ncbi:MAG: S-methyl-5-thioribose-1-phosphate isomerase, partial [Gammaproteobacteria bacterium]